MVLRVRRFSNWLASNSAAITRLMQGMSLVDGLEGAG